ncbi:phage antirepressor [Actinotignum urinale]|uniref:phage antirepressor n=1 Tax=Actinotignum urinale TaxID=190146 RepID=UPI0003B728DC|nr:phage antirepressor [Actinotignum urinale]MDY5159667.1 phage antirepressor [Actinotignum urinale]
MKEVTNYHHPELGSIRVTTINGEVFFVGKDVAEILGYSNPRKALIDHVDNEDKGVTICDTLGGAQELTVINESGLYALILSSHMPKARQFKRWVTAEVLPSIRKHGLYATDELLENPDFLIRALEELKAERAIRKELEMTALIQSQQIAELQPKASYCDIVLSCQDAVNISVIAKDYGMSAKRMNRLLHELGIQFKQGRIWLLYQQYAECGYTKTSTSTYQNSSGQECSAVHTKWTQKGRLFLYNTLKTAGIYPKVEQEVGA